MKEKLNNICNLTYHQSIELHSLIGTPLFEKVRTTLFKILDDLVYVQCATQMINHGHQSQILTKIEFSLLRVQLYLTILKTELPQYEELNKIIKQNEIILDELFSFKISM